MPARPQRSKAAAPDWNGEAYDRLADPQARWGRVVLDRLELHGAETVLDAGCGSGRVTEALIERLPAGRVLALDASPSMLREARRRLAASSGQVRFVQRDLLELRPAALGKDAPVDAVISTATFHWVTDHDRLFANLAGILRPGGQLVAQCGAKRNIETVIAALAVLGMARQGTWLYAGPDETAERLERAGFTDVQVWTNLEPTPFPSDVALADFLETVCLREHLATIPLADRRDLVERVVAAMPAPVIDYVRLNIVARRDETGAPMH